MRICKKDLIKKIEQLEDEILLKRYVRLVMGRNTKANILKLFKNEILIRMSRF